MTQDEFDKLRERLKGELRPRIGVELWDYGERLGVALTIGSGPTLARLECIYPSTMELSEILLDFADHFRKGKSNFAAISLD